MIVDPRQLGVSAPVRRIVGIGEVLAARSGCAVDRQARATGRQISCECLDHARYVSRSAHRVVSCLFRAWLLSNLLVNRSPQSCGNSLRLRQVYRVPPHD